MTIQFPIIISDSGDITVFDTLESAESYLEPCDMNVLTGFDCQGKILEFGIKKESRKILWGATKIEKISVQANAMGYTNKEELQKLLVRYLGGDIRSIKKCLYKGIGNNCLYKNSSISSGISH
jgi:hypothetical protein